MPHSDRARLVQRTLDRTEIQLSGCNGNGNGNGSQRFHLAGTQLMADQSQKCVGDRDNQIWTLR